ncbi:MAG: putative addiction module antidote protein [Bradyrhizobium sp.]|uniref:addiction module antidote protein n=1 Tax=Bradyrhizobium sp. TaxID=376 RepID=UPI0027285930|nr:addiction module antidote protein [Bradyrhizobium sp.]MDO8401316.1 putative addiction module antidote protein [Bradyrhizobium sp.]
MNEQPPPTPSDVATFLNQAFESGDVERICLAIGLALKAHNIADVARKSGLDRPTVYRAFAGNGASPNFTTVIGVLSAMGFRLKVTAKRGGRASVSRIRSRSQARSQS